MILYVNGDSHASAADAVYPRNWAKDDMRYYWMGDLPHPENLAVSWGKALADYFDYHYHCHALPGGSNDRIIRTTKEWINQWIEFKEQWLLVIQWSTWERTEWLLNGRYYQIGASGHDLIPFEYHDQYKKFVSDIDWIVCEKKYHDMIWDFHVFLTNLKIRHLFFNGDCAFSNIENRKNWNNFYIDPYEPTSTYSSWLTEQQFCPVRPNHFHYGKDAHQAWAGFLIDYIKKHQI